ncbi:putative membrane protein F35D113 [Vanrija pseudolonga]|uniref:Purtative membrane protein F35D113 n=1 Tax=Vanrija pseudolonga TaxID=143232 RepID=A0AAF1BIH9_9TREE|nr:purtative membrane protein F35D113 [Vanrija pseudolonga]
MSPQPAPPQAARPPPAPPPLKAPLRFVLALAGLCAASRPPEGVAWSRADADAFLDALLAQLDLVRDVLPPDVVPSDVAFAAEGHQAWTPEDRDALARTLVQACLAPRAGGDKDKPKVVYTAAARAASHLALSLLGLDAGVLLPRAEKDVGATLAAALEDAHTDQAVDAAREKQKHGWGGKLGRGLATGAGVIAGGVLIGVTGGLAAPAIIAALAPLGFGAVSAAVAPFVLGTLFGLTGGGLAGARVADRWRGVEEFSFVEVGAGTKPSPDEVDDLATGRAAVLFDVDTLDFDDEVEEKPRARAGGEKSNDGDDDDSVEAAARREVERSRKELSGRIVQASIDAGTDTEAKVPTPPPPSLTGTIVVPGLLTVSRTEALTSWRAICSPRGFMQYRARLKAEREEKGEKVSDDELQLQPAGLKDGRDVYLLRFETKTMLATGRDIESWVTSKVAGIAGTEVIKRTVLSAYYAAIALPLTVYKLSTMTLDNSWMYAQGRAVKAGRLLGEVLAQRVQGERPVVLIGTSVGSLTVLHALLYLASLPDPKPDIVESAYLVSLPSSPTAQEWAAARSVVARRLVNAWCGNDFVLAVVVRLHEVVSRGVTGNSGICVAGLGPVDVRGVENVNLSGVINGHNEINARAGEILEVIQIDQ